MPRLASDTYRAWIASVPVVGAGAAVAFGRALLRDDETVGELIRFTVAIYLLVIAVYLLVYALLTWRVFGGRTQQQLRPWLSATTPRKRADKVLRMLSGGGAISWSVSTALAALLSVTVVAFNTTLRNDLFILLSAGLLVIAGWVTVPVAFAVHYMRHHLLRPGFAFPGHEEPVFADFVYLAVQISTSFSASDVDILTRAMRRRVTAHSIVAFVFNSVIVALLVSAVLVVAPT